MLKVLKIMPLPLSGQFFNRPVFGKVFQAKMSTALSIKKHCSIMYYDKYVPWRGQIPKTEFWFCIIDNKKTDILKC